MWKEKNPFGMKQIFAVLVSFSVVFCEESSEGSTREKRDYNKQPYSSPSNYGTNNYPSNPYDSEYQPLQCGVPPKCLPIGAIPNQGDPVKTNTTWLANPRTFFQTGGSCWGYSLLAKILLGRDIRVEHELHEMCATQHFTDVGFSYIDGYGRQYVQDCVQNANAGNTCTAVPGSGTEGTDISLDKGEVDYVVLTNSKTFVLYYRCLDNHYGDYMLFTTGPFIDRTDAVEVLETVRLMGFDVNELRFLQCEAPRYPYPFQNYLNEYNYPTCSNSYKSVQPESPANSVAYNIPPAYSNHGNYYAPPAAPHYPSNY